MKFRLAALSEPAPDISALLQPHVDWAVVDNNAEFDSFDACFIDCRNQCVSIPDTLLTASIRLPVIALINENSTFNDQSFSTILPVELATAADMSTPMFIVRLRAAQARLSKMEQADPVRDNAYQILQTIMHLSTDWIAVKDRKHRFIAVSKPFTDAYELTEEHILGKNDLEIGTSPTLVLGNKKTGWTGYWETDRKIFDSGLASINEQIVLSENESGQICERTDKIPLKDKNGIVFAMLVCVTEIYKPTGDAGEHHFRTSAAWDRRSNLEQSPLLKQLHDEKHLAELRTQKSENAYAAKNNFIASASHDLRQPLHALGMFIDTLERRLKDESELFLVSKIKQCSLALSDLLNSLLDISRLDANVMPIETSHFNIDELLQTIHDEHVQAAEEKGLTLHTEISETVVLTDNLLLGRILRNLVGNAINHTHEGSINVSTALVTDKLVITVADTGPGIPNEQQDAVFSEYHQLDNPERDRHKGLGLGLAIVKRLCQLLHIKLELQSTVAKGSQFSISVPLGTTTKQVCATDTKPDEIPVMPAYQIMVIDDDANVREAMQAMLEDHGCLAVVAESANLAVDQITLNESIPDLLLVDYRLRDGITGDQAIDTVCAAVGRDLPAIIITGDTSTASLRKATVSGHKVLNKPVPPEVLMQTVCDLLLV